MPPRTRKARWKAVSFDLDGTLYNYDESHRAALKASASATRRELGLPPHRFLELYRDSREEVHRRLGGTAASHNRLLYFHELMSRWSRGCSLRSVQRLYRAYWSAFFSRMCPFPGARSLLENLRRRSVKLAIVTNMVTHVQFRKINKLGLRDAFDVIVTSEEAGHEKPHGDIFELCLSRLGLEAEQVTHVGNDYAEDVQGARRAGLHPIWFAPRTALRAHSGRQPVRTFSELGKILCRRC